MRIGYEALNMQVPRETKEQLSRIRAEIGIRTLTDTLVIVIDDYHQRMGAQGLTISAPPDKEDNQDE